MPLRILHLSDIHFHRGSVWDDDRDLHEEVVADIARVVADAGPIDVVLVGGDIAFSAEPSEYEKATTWLEKVLGACGRDLQPEHVWTVPGNHDVQRSVVGASQIAQDFRNALTQCDPTGIDLILRRRLVEDPQAHAVMQPLENYNEFATQFGCAITAESPSWTEPTLEVDGYELRITGLNSVLTSDNSDTDDTDKGLSLVLGTQQCRMERGPRRIHVALAHHPPGWLRDWEIVEPYLRRAHVLLFGHEHEFSAEQAVPDGTVFIRAGAVSPERRIEGETEPWIPSYCVVTLAVETEHLRVEIEPRKWDLQQTRFAAHPMGTVVFTVALDPPARNGSGEADLAAAVVATVSASPLVPEDSLEISVEDKVRLRRLSVDFLRLPVSERRRIGRALGVLEDDDLIIPSPELSNLLLQRIRERGLIDALEMELSLVRH